MDAAQDQAEIVRRSFPHGGVPVLAILGTGKSVVWETDKGPKSERRALLVRPPFLRPAHFERAIGFLSGGSREGPEDHARVEAVFAAMRESWGTAGLVQRYETFFERWAEQLAFGFVRRLPHGNNTTSNIAFDGRLVDFGATSAVPSWATIATSRHRTPYLGLFAALSSGLDSLSYYFGRFVDAELGRSDHRTALRERARRVFVEHSAAEVLAVAGVPAALARTASRDLKIQAVTQDAIAIAQREAFDLIDSVPPHRPFSLDEAWNEAPLEPWRALAAVVRDLVPASEREAAKERCRLRVRPYPRLYAPTARTTIYESLERTRSGPVEIQAFVDREVDDALATLGMA